MDDLNDIISSLTPQDIDMLKGVAQSILGSQGQSAAPESERTDPAPPAPAQPKAGVSLPGGLGSQDFQLLMRAKAVFDKMNSASNKNTDLILALKPHLSPKNREKADTAVKILRLFEILPMLREMF